MTRPTTSYLCFFNLFQIEAAFPLEMIHNHHTNQFKREILILILKCHILDSRQITSLLGLKARRHTLSPTDGTTTTTTPKHL